MTAQTGRRATLAALLAAAMAAGTSVVPVFSVLAPLLVPEFGMSRTGLGWLVTGSAGVAAVASLPAGRLTDLLGGRRVVVLTFGMAALSLAVVALAPSYRWLVAAALVGGLPNAAANPATNKLIAQHLPAGGRGLVTGIKQSGVQVGYFLVGALLPGAALAFGWRPALGGAALLLAVGSLAGHRGLPPDPIPLTDDDRRAAPYRHAPAIRWLAAYGLLMGVGVGVIVAYLPLYAHQEVGLSPAAAGALTALAGLVGVGARILWSHRAETARHFALPLGAMAGLSVLAAATIWAAAWAGAWLLWVGAVAVGLAPFAWNAVGMLAVVAETHSRDTGRASGLVLFAFLGGFTASPVLFGASVDALGSYGPGWGAVTVLFLVAGAVTVAWRRRSP